MNRLEESKEKFNKFLSIAKDSLKGDIVLVAKINLAEIFIKQGNYKKAYDLLDGQKLKCNSMISRLNMSILLYHSAFAQFKMKNYRKTYEHLADFFALIKDFSSKYFERDEYQKIVESGIFEIDSNYSENKDDNIKIYIINSSKILDYIFGYNKSFDREHYGLD